MLFRSIGMIPSFCLLYFPVDSISVAHIFLKFITVSFMLAFWWWEFFDGLLNYARNKPWRFNGSDDPDDAKTDDILQGMTPGEQGMLKWGLIIFSTLVYICFFN